MIGALGFVLIPILGCPIVSQIPLIWDKEMWGRAGSLLILSKEGKRKRQENMFRMAPNGNESAYHHLGDRYGKAILG